MRASLLSFEGSSTNGEASRTSTARGEPPARRPTGPASSAFEGAGSPDESPRYTDSLGAAPGESACPGPAPTTEANLLELAYLAASAPARLRGERLTALTRLRQRITVLPIDSRGLEEAI